MESLFQHFQDPSGTKLQDLIWSQPKFLSPSDSPLLLHKTICWWHCGMNLYPRVKNISKIDRRVGKKWASNLKNPLGQLCPKETVLFFSFRTLHQILIYHRLQGHHPLEKYQLNEWEALMFCQHLHRQLKLILWEWFLWSTSYHLLIYQFWSLIFEVGSYPQNQDWQICQHLFISSSTWFHGHQNCPYYHWHW